MSERLGPSPEEISNMQKERTLSDAELLRDGAEYEVDKEGTPVLRPTAEQIKEIQDEHEKRKLLEKTLEDLTEEERKSGYQHKSRISEHLKVLTRERENQEERQRNPWQSDIFVDNKPYIKKRYEMELPDSWEEDSLDAHFEGVETLIETPDCPKCKIGKVFEVSVGSGGTDIADECMLCNYYKQK